MKRWFAAAAVPLLAAAAAPDRAAERWLDANAVGLRTVDPEQPRNDGIGRLCAMTDAAKIVGFGEATHGSREFFQFKDRAFRTLVESCGFRGFAIEANFAAGEAIDDWVKGGEGDPEALVAGMGFWTWDTEEVLALVRWMRAYNLNRETKLGFFGVDIQHAAPNLLTALDFLDRVDGADPSRRHPFSGYLAAARDQRGGYRYMAALADPDRQALLAQSESLAGYIERNRERLIAAGEPDSYLAAASGAIAAAWYFLMEGAEQDRRFRNLRSGYDIRDRAMADLALMASRRLPDNGRLFLWAHNGHVTKDRFEGDRQTMGRFLSAELGSGYLSVGFAFDRGRFQAFPPADPAQSALRPKLSVMQVPAAPDDHSEAVLRRTGGQQWMVDLRTIEAGSPAYGWFAAARPLRWTGANYAPELMEKHKPIGLIASFDLLVFFSETSRARPLQNTRERQAIVKDW